MSFPVNQQNPMQALQSAPQKAPEVDPSHPKVVQQLADTMDYMAYGVLIDIFNWANLWDDIANNKVSEMSEAYSRAMIRPFTGFGEHPAIWGNFSAALTPLIQREILQWMGDQSYRDANTMSWLVLNSIAPAMSASTKGYETSLKAIEILRQGAGEV